MSAATQPIASQWLGALDYQSAWDLQLKHHAALIQDQTAAGIVLGTEHTPAVLTLGKHADLKHLNTAVDEFQKEGIQVIRTDRGGEVTAHMPGQLVVYPVLALARLNIMPRRYITLLEESIIQLLRSAYDLPASRHPEYPGVWINDAKIAAVGVRIAERVSMHGFALNIYNDLSLFHRITPCGISHKSVTSLDQLRPATYHLNDIWEDWLERFYALLGQNGEC